MVAQFSLLTSIALAAASSTTSPPSSSQSASQTLSLTNTSQITAAPAISTPGNSTSAHHSNAQTTLSLFNACTNCTTLDSLTYYASILSVSKSTTVYALGCSQASANATTQCFDPPITVTQAPSFFARVDEGAGMTVNCDVKSKSESAVCVEKYATPTATGNDTQSAQATTYNFDAGMIHYNKLVVTQGVEKLGNATTSSSMATKTPSAPVSATNAGTSATSSQGAAVARAVAGPAAEFAAGMAALGFALFGL